MAKKQTENLNTAEALYLGIEESWDSNFALAEAIFEVYHNQGDVRHTLHQIELTIFKVLITGKKSLIDQGMVKLLKYEEDLNLLRLSMVKSKSTNFPIVSLK